MSLRSVLISLKILAGILWPATTYAAAMSFGEDLAKVPPIGLLLVFILSLVSGIVSLLNGWKVEKPQSPATAAVGHLLGSQLAGWLAFFGAMSQELGDFPAAGAIAVAAYCGARFIDAAAARLLGGSNG